MHFSWRNQEKRYGDMENTNGVPESKLLEFVPDWYTRRIHIPYLGYV